MSDTQRLEEQPRIGGACWIIPSYALALHFARLDPTPERRSPIPGGAALIVALLAVSGCAWDLPVPATVLEVRSVTEAYQSDGSSGVQGALVGTLIGAMIHPIAAAPGAVIGGLAGQRPGSVGVRTVTCSVMLEVQSSRWLVVFQHGDGTAFTRCAALQAGDVLGVLTGDGEYVRLWGFNGYYQGEVTR